MFLSRYRRLLAEFATMPRARVDLMLDRTAGNDPFFARVVGDYYRYATARRPTFPLLRRMSHGVALCRLPETFAQYYTLIEGSARRNHRKACREGCEIRRIQYNDHLDAVGEVRMSAPRRQGRPVPEGYVKGIVSPSTDPPSNSRFHDYPYFGVFEKDKLVGYASCLIAGDHCSIEHILGHASHQHLGIVPLLIIGIAEELYRAYPQVKFYVYGTYFGAGETLQRFKRKFGFVPHRVDWDLGEQRAAPSVVHCPAAAACRSVELEIPEHLDFQLVYRMERAKPLAVPRRDDVRFALIDSASAAIRWLGPLSRCTEFAAAVKTVIKSASPRRSLYLLAIGSEVVSTGWCTVGTCRHYRVEPDCVVFGPIWTADAARGKGFAPYALQVAVDEFIRRGRSIFYIDTSKSNVAAQRVIEKCGFGRPMALFLR